MSDHEREVDVRRVAVAGSAGEDYGPWKERDAQHLIELAVRGFVGERSVVLQGLKIPMDWLWGRLGLAPAIMATATGTDSFIAFVDTENFVSLTGYLMLDGPISSRQIETALSRTRRTADAVDVDPLLDEFCKMLRSAGRKDPFPEFVGEWAESSLSAPARYGRGQFSFRDRRSFG